MSKREVARRRAAYQESARNIRLYADVATKAEERVLMSEHLRQINLYLEALETAQGRRSVENPDAAVQHMRRTKAKTEAWFREHG
jgi:hypothetical protein